MAVISFPGVLPAPMIEGYGYKHKSNMGRTKTQHGSARQRRMTQGKNTTITLSWEFTAEELATFEGFSKHALRYFQPFTYPLKTANGMVEHEVSAVPGSIKTKYINDFYWSVSMSMQTQRFVVMSQAEATAAGILPLTQGQLPVFPVSLPTPEKAYSYKDVKNAMVSPTDIGPINQRAKELEPDSEFSMSWLFTDAELALFEGFIHHALAEGAAWFEMLITTATGRSTHQVRFINDKLKVSLIANNLWRVTHDLDVKQRATLTEEQTASITLEPNTTEQFVTGVEDAVDSYQE